MIPSISNITLLDICSCENFCLAEICASKNIAQIYCTYYHSAYKDCSALIIEVSLQLNAPELLVLHIIGSYIIATLRFSLSVTTLYLDSASVQLHLCVICRTIELLLSERQLYRATCDFQIYVQPCNHATMQLCNYTNMQPGNYATMQLSNCATI